MFGVSYLRLTVIGLVLLALAAAGWKLRVSGEQAGRAEVQAKWDKEKAVQVADALVASEKRRNDEKALNITNQGITNAYQKEKSRLVAAASSLNDSLQQLKATINSPASPNSARAPGANGTGGLERELLGSCAENLSRMAITADRLEAKVVGLQNYVLGVCKSE